MPDSHDDQTYLLDYSGALNDESNDKDADRQTALPVAGRAAHQTRRWSASPSAEMRLGREKGLRAESLWFNMLNNTIVSEGGRAVRTPTFLVIHV